MIEIDDLHIELQQHGDTFAQDYDLDKIIYDLDSQIELLSSQADNFDCLVAICSGVLCGLLDIFWVGGFNLKRGRSIASNKIEKFVIKTAKLLGCKKDGLKSAIEFLEDKRHLPSDGNTSDFGGGLHHHLRDFAHHPTIVGLMFSLLTQFSYKSYGTNVNGVFITVDVPEASKAFIGKDVQSKIIYGTITWFFHLVSDMAGSNKTAIKSGGTGIPGPLLALAKELSVLPFFRNLKAGDNTLPVFLSKLFNGTLFKKRDEAGLIIRDTVVRFDLRGELGVGVEMGRQAIPVLANDCIVRSFFFIRRLALEIREHDIHTITELKQIDLDSLMPINNPTIARMLTISTAVFTTVDLSDAIITHKYWVSINYVGVGRFAVAIGEDVASGLKARNTKKIKKMYEDIRRFSYTQSDENIFQKIGVLMDIDKLSLTVGQIEILYNIEYYKTLNDIRCTKALINNEAIRSLKQNWLDEWKDYISKGFSSFTRIQDAKINWFTEQELLHRIDESEPQNPWFRLVLLETMLFEPYFPLVLAKGNHILSKKYSDLQNIISGYKKSKGDNYIDSFFTERYYSGGYIKRLRNCYNTSLRDLNQVFKTVIASLSFTALLTIMTMATAGTLAPAIAVALVGSNFAGLSGAALTSACLAYLGGGALAVGGAGMAGGTVAIIGGGAVLGLGVSAGVSGTAGSLSLIGKENTIIQSAKLLVSIQEIFLNDEQDIQFAKSALELYVLNIMNIEKGLVELKLQADVAKGKEKKELHKKIKNTEESVVVMKTARRKLNRLISVCEEGFNR